MVVIGSGPGGYVAAIKAAQLGLKVCLLILFFLRDHCMNALKWCSTPSLKIHQLERFIVKVVKHF